MCADTVHEMFDQSEYLITYNVFVPGTEKEPYYYGEWNKYSLLQMFLSNVNTSG